MRRNSPHPATIRLLAKLEEIGLSETEQQLDFAGWMSGLSAGRLDDLGSLSPAESMQIVQRIENSWLIDSLLDDWRAARRKEADTTHADTEYGDFLIRDDSGAI